MRWPLLYQVSTVLIGIFFILIVWDVVAELFRSIKGEKQDWTTISPSQADDDRVSEGIGGLAFRASDDPEINPAGAAKGTLETLRRRHRRTTDIRQRAVANSQPNRSWKARKPSIR